MSFYLNRGVSPPGHSKSSRQGESVSPWRPDFRESNRGAPGGRALPAARGLDDLNEAARVETCATDKSAVNVGLAHELACVLRFNTPAILNAYALCGRIIGHLVQSVANERVGFLRLSGRGIAASADRPDRLIGYDRFLQFLWTQTGETATQLDR